MLSQADHFALAFVKYGLHVLESTVKTSKPHRANECLNRPDKDILTGQRVLDKHAHTSGLKNAIDLV